MKLITAIINKRDSSEVCRILSDKGFYFTKIATSGGFLSSGNVTLLIGTEDDKVNSALEIIRKNSAKRVEEVPDAGYGDSMNLISRRPVTVPVGGATVFVTDVEHFEKM